MHFVKMLPSQNSICHFLKTLYNSFPMCSTKLWLCKSPISMVHLKQACSSSDTLEIWWEPKKATACNSPRNMHGILCEGTEFSAAWLRKCIKDSARWCWWLCCFSKLDVVKKVHITGRSLVMWKSTPAACGKSKREGRGEGGDDANQWTGGGGVDMSPCLLIGWRCTQNKRQSQPVVTFQITLCQSTTHLPPTTQIDTHALATPGTGWAYPLPCSKKCHLGDCLKCQTA